MGGKEPGDKALFDLAGHVVAVIGGTGVLGGARLPRMPLRPANRDGHRHRGQPDRPSTWPGVGVERDDLPSGKGGLNPLDRAKRAPTMKDDDGRRPHVSGDAPSEPPLVGAATIPVRGPGDDRSRVAELMHGTFADGRRPSLSAQRRPGTPSRILGADPPHGQ